MFCFVCFVSKNSIHYWKCILESPTSEQLWFNFTKEFLPAGVTGTRWTLLSPICFQPYFSVCICFVLWLWCICSIIFLFIALNIHVPVYFVLSWPFCKDSLFNEGVVLFWFLVGLVWSGAFLFCFVLLPRLISGLLFWESIMQSSCLSLGL